MPILHNHLLILNGPMRTLETGLIAINVTKVYSGFNWQHVEINRGTTLLHEHNVHF